MTDRIAGGLVLATNTLTEAFAKTLALPNAAHAQALRMRERGKRVPMPPATIDPCLWSANCIDLPRRAPWGGTVADWTVLPTATAIPTTLVLRDYQRRALGAWWTSDRNGLIEAPCGAGKTAMGLTAVCHAPTPALVLVHTKDLLRQWAERAEAVGIRADVIADGKAPVTGRLVVATMQTVIRWGAQERREWGATFGLVVTDEAHHVPADTWGRVLYDLPGRWRLGLSATPDRTDGLTPLLGLHIGPTRARVEQADLVGAGVVLAPRVHRVLTGWAPTPGIEFVEMITEATEHDGRNASIVSIVERLVLAGRQVLVQTERVEHTNLLAGWLAEVGVLAVAVHAKLGKKEREARLRSVERGTARVLVATQLADEGLDLPTLDALVLAVPQRNAPRLQQRVGRVSRTAKGKTDAVVIDLIDGGIAERLWWTRLRVYKALGCAITDGMPRMQGAA